MEHSICGCISSRGLLVSLPKNDLISCQQELRRERWCMGMAGTRSSPVRSWRLGFHQFAAGQKRKIGVQVDPCRDLWGTVIPTHRLQTSQAELPGGSLTTRTKRVPASAGYWEKKGGSKHACFRPAGSWIFLPELTDPAHHGIRTTCQRVPAAFRPLPWPSTPG